MYVMPIHGDYGSTSCDSSGGKRKNFSRYAADRGAVVSSSVISKVNGGTTTQPTENPES
jgi:hypothetical protein